MRRWAGSGALAALLFLGCGGGTTPGSDSGAIDAGGTDAGPGITCGTLTGATTDQQIVRAIVQPFIDSGALQSVMVAIVRGASIEYVALGRLSATDGSAPTENTIYELGSITKPFTGLMLASMVDDGTLRLNQTVASLLPTETIPSLGGVEITLEDLATHYSGLPRNPDDRAPFVNSAMDPPYTDAQMLAFLARHALTSAPGTDDLYSNLGANLTGYAIAQVAGVSYEQLLAARVTTPLGMTNTGVTLTMAQHALYAPPHFAGRHPAPERNPLNFTAAGAIRSSAADLVTLLRAYLDPTHAMASILALSSTGRRQRGTRMQQWALFWKISGNGRITWHDGITPGHRAIVHFSLVDDVATVFLTNSAHHQAFAINDAVYFALLGTPVTIPCPRADVSVPLATLSSHVGTYSNPFTGPLVIRIESGRLVSDIMGLESMWLFAESDRDFYARRFPAELSFSADGSTVTGRLFGSAASFTRVP